MTLCTLEFLSLLVEILSERALPKKDHTNF